MFEHPQLIIFHAAVIVIAVHLSGLQTEHVISSAAVTDHTLSAARIMPGLLAFPIRSGSIVNFKYLIGPFASNKRGVGPFIVPFVRVTYPFILLSNHKSRFDPMTRCRIARLTF